MRGITRITTPVLLVLTLCLLSACGGCASVRYKWEDFKQWWQTDVTRF